MVRVYATIRDMSTIRDPVKQYMLLDAAGPRLPTEEEFQGRVKTSIFGDQVYKSTCL